MFTLEILGGLIKLMLGRASEGERWRFRHMGGLLSPRMNPHYRRWWRVMLHGGEGRWHVTKNLWSEWTRLDANRAAKVYMSIIEMLIVACLL